jgi:hypothetical protein
MSFIIPTAIHQMTEDWDSDTTRRSGFTEGQWDSRNTKPNGSLPISSIATGFVNTSSTSTQGCYWAFPSSYDVSSDTKVFIFLYQYNAPNRIEIDTVDNNGIMIRLGSGTSSTSAAPTNYKSFQMGGRDTAIGKAREFPVHIVTDLNADNQESEVGTYDNTDVNTFGFGSKTLNMGGTTTQIFLQRCFVFDTTKDATDIPRFTGGNSTWDDVITAMGTSYDTKITHGWLAREGTIFSIACPIEIGDNTTATTFNDNGVSVFYPDDDEPSNPRVRVTEQAFRFYLNLRDNSADTATFSGSYDCGNSYPLWDFNQNDNAIVTLNNVSFKRTGTFKVGSSVTGVGIWDDCGIVEYQDNGVDLDGSTFKNPHSTHLISLVA